MSRTTNRRGTMALAIRAAATALLMGIAADTAAAQAKMPEGKDKAADKGKMGAEMGMMGAEHGKTAGSAEYTLVVKGLWTPERHPKDYPSGSAHFSGIIGATHANGFMLFKEGMKPTPGLERLSEMGAHSPLDAELKAAVAAGKAGAVFESGALKDFRDSIVVTVKVDEKHPLLSFVAMIAPSPDWFTGVMAVDLMKDGHWMASRTLDLYAYDSGGDEGTTYRAADVDNDPKKPTTRAPSTFFGAMGAEVPVARVTITRR